MSDQVRKTANDVQIGGQHYKSPIQHWDYVIANELNYFEGQITKYVTRCRKKNQALQDLDKAMHFLKKYREVLAQSMDTIEDAETQREIAESRRNSGA